MLDDLLECGWNLPVLELVLAWTTPSSWLRLRCARRAFFETLSTDRLKALSVGFAKPTSLFEAVDNALRARSSASLSDLDGFDEFEAEPGLVNETEDTISGTSACDLHACEVAYAASLQGLDMNDFQQHTGVTSLMRAAEESHIRLCQMLLAQRADADAKTVGGATALSLILDPCCVRCMTMSQRHCKCPRPEAAQLLFKHTKTGLPSALASTVRLALQDSSWLSTLTCLINEVGMDVNMIVDGPDSRHGTPLSVALEAQVRPVESSPKHRPAVVARLISMRANISPPHGRHVGFSAWWGGTTTNLLEFAELNKCDQETLEVLHTIHGAGS